MSVIIQYPVVIRCNMRLSHDVLPWQAARAASTSAAVSIAATAIVLVLIKLQNSKILNKNNSQKLMQCNTSINNPIFPHKFKHLSTQASETHVTQINQQVPDFPLTQMQPKHLLICTKALPIAKLYHLYSYPQCQVI